MRLDDGNGDDDLLHPLRVRPECFEHGQDPEYHPLSRTLGRFAAGTLSALGHHAFPVARALADERYSEIADKRTRQFRAYSEATDDELFKTELVSVELGEFDVPGSPRSRVMCSVCGEGVNDGREVVDASRNAICRSCYSGSYYSKLDNPTA